MMPRGVSVFLTVWTLTSSCRHVRPEGTESTQVIDLTSATERIIEDLNGISDVVQLPNGVIVFGEVYENRLVYLTLNPHSVQHVGREGRGPGEFLRIDGVLKLRADTIAVLDVISRRLSVFDGQGHFVRAVSLRTPPDGSMWLDCTFYSDSLGSVYAVPTKDRSRHRFSNALDTLPILRLSTDGTTSDQVWAIEVRAPQWFPMSNGHVRTRTPFTAPLVIGVADNGAILATTWDGRALVARSAEGLVTRTPPFGLSQRKVTKAERDSFTTWFTSRATYSGAQFEFPEERASFDHGQISPKGEVWLRSTESIEGRTTYIVVDAAGRVKGKVLVPVGGQIVGFGSRTQFVSIVNSTGNSDLYVLSLADSILANW
jgi:hypothetical protein